MSKKLLIWLSIIAVLLVIIGWFTYWQWNNITAFVDALRYSNEEVESKLQENNQAIQQYLQKDRLYQEHFQIICNNLFLHLIGKMT